MKFGKSYMETLASPSFPKEWRDGAIEYKQLKKLINGVVAELESLGLGADVLRELIVPVDGERQQEEASTSEGKSAQGASANVQSSLTPQTPASLFRHQQHDSHAAADSEEDVLADEMHHVDLSTSLHRSSGNASLSVPRGRSHRGTEDNDEQARHDDLSSSPAADWVASIAHAEHLRHSGHHRRRRSTRKVSDSQVRSSDSADQDAQSSNGLADEAGNFQSKSRVPLRGSLSRSPHSSDQGEGSSAANRSRFLSTQSGLETWNGSEDNNLSPDEERKPRVSSSMGRKDLEAFRRRNSSADRQRESHTTGTAKEAPQEAIHDWGGQAWRERAAPQPPAAKSGIKSGKWVQGKDGRRARAEYELGGTAERPEPRIRLFVESPVASDEEDSPGDDADGESEGSEVGSDDQNGAAGENVAQAQQGERKKTRRNVAKGANRSKLDAVEKHIEFEDDASGEDEDRFEELVESPRGSLKNNPPLKGEPSSPMLLPQNEKYADGRRVRVREIVIPLSADTEFLDTLTGALSNLSTLQEQQREQFTQNTEALCKIVSQVASPAHKEDMYAWREIFALWTELQIFESQREKDRGELSVEESELRLKRFAEELAKRGWNTHALDLDAAQRKKHGIKLGHKGALARFMHHGHGSSALPMKDPRSIAALEEFLKLNLALLDVKKFQRVNVEAARKILKKHDKRTALTASNDLGAFVEQQESLRVAAASAAAGVGVSSLVAIPEHKVASTKQLVASHGAATHPSLAALLPTSTSALMSSSLPHILLSLLSTALLPILPTIDDYSCAICTDVAWRPIKLDCGHLFCIRCLVKLQKQGKNDCPLCRAPGVVESADEHNMDPETVKFLQEHFPREVKQKQKDNEKDRHREELLELGLIENERCIVT